MLRHHRLALCVLVAALAVAGPANASAKHPKHRHSTPPSVAPSTPAPAAAGMVVGVDPESGQLGVPNRAQVSTLLGLPGLALNHSSDGLTPRRLADGSLMLDLQGRFREYYLVQVDAQGRIVPQCLGDPVSVRRALVTPPPPAPLEER